MTLSDSRSTSTRLYAAGSIVNEFLQSLKATPLVGQVEWLVDMREWSVIATHSLDRSLEM